MDLYSICKSPPAPSRSLNVGEIFGSEVRCCSAAPDSNSHRRSPSGPWEKDRVSMLNLRYLFSMVHISFKKIRCLQTKKEMHQKYKSLLQNKLIHKKMRFLHLVQALTGLDQAELMHFIYLYFDQTQRDRPGIKPKLSQETYPFSFFLRTCQRFLVK